MPSLSFAASASASQSAPLFSLRGVHKAFDGQQVLKEVNLDIYRGEFLTIIGASGSGKSILLRFLIGLMQVDGGTVSFDGEEVSQLPERAWVRVRQRVGMLFQESALFDSMTVHDNVAYGLREHRLLSETKIAERVSESLGYVGLPGIEHMWPNDLSGGMQKRVALARAMAMHPEVVLYDEPTEGLDPINVTRVNRLLQRLQRALNITTVVVTHNMKSAFTTSDRVAMLHEGHVLHACTPKELRERNDPTLKAFVGNRLNALQL